MRPFSRGRGNYRPMDTRQEDSRPGASRGGHMGRGYHVSRGGQMKRSGRGYLRSMGGQRGREGGNPECDESFDSGRGNYYNTDNFRKTNYRSQNHGERSNEGSDLYDKFDQDYEYHNELHESSYGREFENFSNRSRHESDTMEYLERDRHKRDDIEFSEREYDHFYKQDDERDNIRYEREYNWDSRSDYGRDTFYDERDVMEDRIRYEDDPYNRQNSNYSPDRYDDYEEDNRYNRRDSYEYQDFEQVRNKDPLSNNERRKPDERDFNRNDYRKDYNERNFNISKKGKYHDQHVKHGNRKPFEIAESERVVEVIAKDPLNTQSSESSYDWPTNESGIKMAIEFLKKKPIENTSECKTAEVTEKPTQEEPNFPVIKHDNLEQEAIEDLVSDLLNIILKNGGEISMRALEKDFEKSVQHRFKNEKDLKNFLEKFPGVFEFDNENSFTEEYGAGMTEEKGSVSEIVRAKTEVKLCQAHSTHPKSCNGDCNALHICKFYVLSSCEIVRCKFGHNLSDDHNIAVQQKFYLHRVELPNLCLLLQHDANRCSVTVPIICRYYNSIKGCRSDENVGKDQQQKCPFLHICRNFVENRCNVWSSCRRNHNLLQKGSYELLCKYGLDPRVLINGQNRVLTLLNWSVNNFNERDIKGPKNRYQPVELKRAEEVAFAKQNLKRKVQVGGDDDISIKIQKVMETSLNSSSDDKMEVNQTVQKKKSMPFEAQNLLKNAALKITESHKSRNASTTCSNLDKNMNVSSETIDNGVDILESIETTVPSWSLSENNKWKDVSQTVLKDFEEKYQKYVSSKTATVLIDGKYFEVDFTKLEGKYAGSSAIVKIQRKLKKATKTALGD